MKQLGSIELLSLLGGEVQLDCMWLLQYEANTHKDSGNKEMEDLYWHGWALRYNKCVGILE